MRLRLLVFDVDGTLVDSQHMIVEGLTAAFEAAGRVPPARERMLSIVGLSLGHAFEALVPEAAPDEIARMVETYKATYQAARARGPEGAPFYPGAREMLAELAQVPELLLGVATGKSRRGFDILMEMHGLSGFFHTVQTSDGHPSKPHPAMLQAALADCGVVPADAAMLGDTSFDMEMARAAGVPALGVSWGYHPAEVLAGAGAEIVLNEFAALPEALREIWG